MMLRIIGSLPPSSKIRSHVVAVSIRNIISNVVCKLFTTAVRYPVTVGLRPVIIGGSGGQGPAEMPGAG
jgi:hypothetical protein